MKVRVAFALTLGLLLCRPDSFGQTNEVEAIRQEMEQLRREYEDRLRNLEDRLRRLDGQVSSGVVVPPAPGGTREGAANSNTVETATAPRAVTEPISSAASQARSAAPRFRSGMTESRQRAIAARQDEALRERMEQVLEGFVDIGGYFRAGYGANDRGGPQAAFQAPGAFSKYRLGNEAEVYGELSFAKNFFLPNIFALKPEERPSTGLTGPVARVEVRLSAYNPYEDLLTASGTDFGLPEAWASIANVVPGQPLLNIWAGSRFYRRHDIHISDFYFYNMSGAGGGIEDVDLRFGKGALAWIGSGATSGFSDVPQPDPENRAGFSKDNLDLRVYEVPVPLGKGEFGVVLARATSGRDAQGRSVAESEGFSLTALHTREQFLSRDGYNKFSLQFGTGPAKTFTSGFETFRVGNDTFIRPDAENSLRFRATEHFVANLGPHFSLSPAVVYQFTDQGDRGGIQHWASAGVRPVLHFNRYLSLAFEGGVDWVDDEQAGTSDYVAKFTVAPQVSLGNRFLSRPVVRLYATHGLWGNSFVGRVGGPDYRDRDSGWVYGLQMEAWW